MKNIAIILTLLLTSFSTELIAQRKSLNFGKPSGVITTEQFGEITSYSCNASGKKEVAFEVGYFSKSQFEGKGYIPYEGESQAVWTKYTREGLYKVWDWGYENEGRFKEDMRYSIRLNARLGAKYSDNNTFSDSAANYFSCTKVK